nr:MAG TPA: hypothetical protein [Caudoviricetes sp.]
MCLFYLYINFIMFMCYHNVEMQLISKLILRRKING